jgi:hypothetical protein
VEQGHEGVLIPGLVRYKLGGLPWAFRFLAGRSKQNEEGKLVPCSDVDQELLRLVVIHFPYICSIHFFL